MQGKDLEFYKVADPEYGWRSISAESNLWSGPI